jgi:hypothetical protein
VLLNCWIVSSAEEQKTSVDVAKRDYWEELYKASEACYNSDKLRIDLLSKKEKEELYLNKIQLIFMGADVLKEREIALKKLDIIKNEKEKLGAALSQEGLAGIKALQEMKEKIAESEAVILTCEKKFEGVLRVCNMN